MSPLPSRGECGHVFDRTEQVKLPKVRYDFIEVQFQNFDAHAGARTSTFLFSKNVIGVQILLFFCENWHEASFYIKEIQI